jgi:ElaB/YqjD/DUF883 family membrane-anchored ribosome-binding protein
MTVFRRAPSILLTDASSAETVMKSGIESFSENLRKLLEDAETLLQGAANRTDTRLDEAGETAQAALHRACGHLRNARDEVAGKAREVNGEVHAHPWRAVAAAAIVAFVAGLLVRRR